MTLISAMCRPALDRRRSQPTLEVLEDRNLLSAGISGLSASHMVTITGTDLAETATVRYDNRGTASYLDDRVVVTMSNEIRTWEKAFTAWRFTSTSSGFHMSPNVLGVSFLGYGGNDTFKNETGIVSFARGHGGNDKLLGGVRSERFYGSTGNDLLEGGGGRDPLTEEDHPNSGNDTLNGGEGSTR